ncbi:MAG: helicase-exonuclease AddAB subunit AddA [Lachnospira sp.]|nr:helicase-exonuclease AddAB subunit AddA [Lachnospira sp.]
MPEWTPEQKKAIDTRDRNLLVSAAAGSGKTAVLVQRVIEEITDPDPDKQRDIDSLVIVTFTRASAAEMKERLRTRLQAMQHENPENEVLRRQLRLLPDAPICTIDSFCLKLVREHYTEIGLDPGFHTADESESALLAADVLDAMFEEHYAADESGEEISFGRIARLYGAGKDDRRLAECITMIWKTAQSFAWPDEWLAHCADAYDLDAGQLLAWGPVREVLESVREEAQACLSQADEIRQLLVRPGADKYGKNVDDHETRLKALLAAESPDAIRAVLSGKPLRKATVRAGKNTDSKAAGTVSAWLDRCRKAEDAFGGLHLDSAEEDARRMRPYAQKLARLTLEFDTRFREAKAERGMLEFSDIEHYALQILTRREDGKTIYTPTADELAAQYQEILIDEYQDSNRLQEEILKAVSHTRLEGKSNNITMVGDLKQSIYRFRQADPELFAQKSRAYTADGADFSKVMLNRNFRSRRGVIDSVNAVFSDVMSDAAGGTDYGEGEALTFGFTPYDTAPLPSDGKVFSRDEGRTEVYLIPSEKADGGRQAQAVLIADRIRELLAGGYQVYDAHEGGYRPLAKKDIAVLTRSAAQAVPVLVRTLEDAGIDCYAQSRSGFFSAWEIQQVVSLLQIIDNPLQDIPAAAVMLSYFGGFSADELTRVRLAGRRIAEESGKKRRQDEFLWMSLRELAQRADAAGTDGPAYADGPEDVSRDVLARRCRAFITQTDAWREDSRVLSVHDLLWELVCDTGFYRYAGTLKGGRRRTANLDSLLSYAADFDKTGYHGLFQFLRYIGQIQASDEIALGEQSAVREDDDVVRIMTIHKSKGLEFPVVFVAEMGKDYKSGPENSKVAASRDGGLILKPLDEARRACADGLLWNAAKQQSEAEDKSEEMRLLYVAMTRAREKLILVGSVKRTAQEKKDGALTRWDSAKKQSQRGSRSAQSVLEGRNYFDLVMPKVLALMEAGGESPFVMAEKPEELFAESESGKAALPERKVTAAIPGSEEASWRGQPYPFPLRSRQKPKVSVSEIKRQMFAEEQEERAGSEADFLKEAARREAVESGRTVPRFLQTERRYSAPARGTAYHRVMELLDFTRADSPGLVKEQMQQMLADGKISPETAGCVSYSRIAAFFATDLGKKAAQAASAGALHREQPFLFERPYEGESPDDALPEAEAQDVQLVQGVIDLYFEYEGELYLVDYKTDRVKAGAEGERELAERYRIQLDLYAKALAKASGREPSYKYIYSFTLMKELLS